MLKRTGILLCIDIGMVDNKREDQKPFLLNKIAHQVKTQVNTF